MSIPDHKTGQTTEYEFDTLAYALKTLNLPLCKRLREKLRLCIELSHSEFCGEAGPIPVRSRENIEVRYYGLICIENFSGK